MPPKLLAFALQQKRLSTGKRPTIRKKVRRPTATRSLERDYLARVILPILAHAKRLIADRLLPLLPELAREAKRDETDPVYVAVRPGGCVVQVRADSFVDVLADIFDNLPDDVTSSWDLGRALYSVAAQVDAHNQRATAATIKSLTGLDVPPSVPGLEDKLAAFARQNAQLIKSIPAEYLHDVEQTTLRALRTGKRAEEIAGELEDNYGVAANRAALIARDQIGKLNGELTEVRQTGLGITRYIWRGVGDGRERPEHVAREGQIFAWDDPPEDGHPGQPIQCRCWAEPVIEDLLE